MPAAFPRILVVYKKSAYQLHMVERRDRHLRRLLRARHPDVVDLLEAHRVHQRTLEAVIRAVQDLKLRIDVIYRELVKSTAGYDLVICVGGDGTVLQTSHVVRDIPVLGVNSDPRRSEAVFCAANASNFLRLVRLAVGGRLPISSLYRLQVRRNDRPIGPLVLNDVLITHEDPATMSRYRLRIGTRHETHKSSGLWVATAAGSSSAILAAGGQRLAWEARRFQYRPRELYRGRLSRGRLTGGVLRPRQRADLMWLMREGSLFIDGPRVVYPLQFGDRVTVSLSLKHPLRLLGLRQ